MPSNDPVELASELKAKGMSRGEIADYMMNSGYSAVQASEALSQAEISDEMDEVPVPQSPTSEMRASVMDSDNGENLEDPIQSELSEPVQSQEQMQQKFNYEIPRQKTISFQPRNELMEEIAESVVSEKWSKFLENYGELSSWKDRVEMQLSAIKQEVLRIETRFDSLQKSVIGKVQSYDQNIMDVGAEIKALEKVLQKILQPLSSNIKELQKITDDLKGKR